MRRMISDATSAKGSAGNASTEAAVSPGNLPGDSGGRNIKKIQTLVVSIALLALATHFLYFSHFRNFYSSDSSTYITPASNLIHGRGFTGLDGRVETVRTPGYPLLIVPFLLAGADLKYLVILQHLMQVALIVATVIVAFKLSGSGGLALIVGIIFLIDLPMLEAANHILTETFFTVVFASALWLLWTGSMPPEGRRWNRLLFSGLLAGASVLIRPVALYFFVPAAVYLLLAKGRLRSVFIFVAAFACFPLLWAARNYHQTGYFTVSSVSGQELLCWRAGGILALEEPGDFNANVAKRCTQLENTVCSELKTQYGKDCSEFSSAQKSAYEMQLARRILAQNPIGYLKLALRGAAVMLLDGGPSSLQGITGINPHVGIRLLLIYTVPALCFALAGLWELWKRNRQLFFLCFLTTAYFVAVSAGGDSYSR